MHRLLNIERNGGYPLCSENLSIIDENARMLELFIGNLNLPDKSAIILSERTNTAIGGSVIGTNSSIAIGGVGLQLMMVKNYLFVFNGTDRELLPVRVGSTLLWQGNRPAIRVQIDGVNQNVTNESNQPIADVYQQRYADLYETTDPDEAWTFYNLTEVLETGLWEPVNQEAQAIQGGSATAIPLSLPVMRYSDSSDAISLPHYLSDSTSVECNVFKNVTKLRLKASYRFTAPSVNGQGTLYIQCRAGISTPAPVICYYTYNGGNGTITGHLSGNDIVLPMDAFTPGVEYDLYFNQEILL